MDYAMGWTKYNLILLGVWPDPGTAHSRQLSSFVFWSTVFVTVTFVNVPQMAYLILRSTNLDEAIENLSVNVPIMFALSKHVALRYHRRELALLVREVMNNWSGPLTKSDRQLMLKNAVISRSISIVLSSFAYVMYIAFVILQVMSNIQDSSKIELKGLLHPSIFPYDTRKSPNLQISWLGQFIGSGSMALSYSSFDSLLAILVLHLCGQLSILRNALEDRFEICLISGSISLLVSCACNKLCPLVTERIVFETPCMFHVTEIFTKILEESSGSRCQRKN